MNCKFVNYRIAVANCDHRSLVIKSQINDKEVIETIDAVLSITEGVATFNFKDVNSIQKIDNFMNILNNKDAINKTIDLILPNNDNNCDDKCDK